MKLILNLSFGLILLFLSSTTFAVPGDLQWESYYDREGALVDGALSMAVSGSTVFVAGTTQTTTGGYAFSVRAYATATGTVSWENHYDREGSLEDGASAVVANTSGVFVAGWTQTTAGGYAFSVRAYNATTGALLWENHYDREGSLDDWANAVAATTSSVFVVGTTKTSTGGYAFSVRAYNATTGALLWENHYDAELALEDTAQAVAVSGTTVYVSGWTQTAAGGYAFSIRTYDATNGTLLWENYYNAATTLTDVAYSVATDGTRVFVAGLTRTSTGGNAFVTRAHTASSGTLLWTDISDGGTVSDVALLVVVSGTQVYTVGFVSSTTLGYRFSIRVLPNSDTLTLIWRDRYNRDATSALDDTASCVAVSGTKVFVAGWTQTTAATGGYGFSIRVYNTTSPMTLLWENHYNREGALDDWVNCIATDATGVFVGGITATSAGGYAFSVRAFAQ